MTKKASRARAIEIYEVHVGFNVILDSSAKAAKFGPGIVLKTDAHREVRYEIGTKVRRDELPNNTDVDWLISRGALVLIDKVEPPEEEDTNGEA